MGLIEDLQNNKSFMDLPIKDRTRAFAKLNPSFGELDPVKQRLALTKIGLGELNTREKVSKFAHEVVPPVAAGLAGAAGFAAPFLTVAGAPAAPASGALAGATAYFGSQQLLNRADEAMGIKDPPTAAGLGSEVLSDATTAAAQELPGPLLQAGAKGVSEASPAVGRGLVRAAEKMGVKMTPAQISKLKPLAWIEAIGEKFLPTMLQFKGRRAVNLQALENEAENVLETIGSSQSREAIGAEVQGGIPAQMMKRLDTRNKLFDKTRTMVAENTAIGFDNLRETADKLLVADAQVPPYFRQVKAELLDSLAHIRQQGLSWDGAMSLRKKINSMIGPIVDTAEKMEILKPLRKALDMDLAAFADQTGGPLLKTFKLANTFHGAVKQLMDNPVVQAAVKARPDQVARTLLERNSPDTWTVMRKALPEKTFRTLQRAVVDEMFSLKALPPGDVQANFPLGKLPEVLSQNMRRFRGDVLEAALPKGLIGRLQEFANIARTVTPTWDSLAGNASGTSASMAGGAGAYQLAKFTFKNPLTGIPLILSTPVLANMYLSDAGRKLVTDGLKFLTPYAAISKSTLTAAERLAAAKTYRAIETYAREHGYMTEPKPADAPVQPGVPQSNTPSAVAAPSPISARPRSPAEGAYLQGLASFMKGDYGTSAKFAKQALQIDPKNKEAQRMLERLQQKGAA